MGLESCNAPPPAAPRSKARRSERAGVNSRAKQTEQALAILRRFLVQRRPTACAR
jgi:hypothetical protein